jgi:hypothetical protein
LEINWAKPVSRASKKKEASGGAALQCTALVSLRVNTPRLSGSDLPA